MQVKIFYDNSDINFYSAGRKCFEAESLGTRHNLIFKLHFRSDSEQIGSQCFEVALGLWCPTLNLH